MIKKILQSFFMHKGKQQKKNIVDFFTVVSPEERERVLRQAVRESNQDQKAILDYARQQKPHIFKNQG